MHTVQIGNNLQNTSVTVCLVKCRPDCIVKQEAHQKMRRHRTCTTK